MDIAKNGLDCFISQRCACGALALFCDNLERERKGEIEEDETNKAHPAISHE